MLLDTTEYLSVLQQLTEEGHEVRLQISGSSMAPFLHHGRDAVFFRRPDSPLRVGQIVFYQRSSGQYVVHRICKIRDGKLYLAGDAQTVLEGPIPPEAVFARVTRVCRGEKQLQPDALCWRFYAVVWRWCRPFRRQLLLLYNAFSCCLRRL